MIIALVTLKANLGCPIKHCYSSKIFSRKYIGYELLFPRYEIITKFPISKVHITPCLAMGLTCFKKGKLSLIH